MEVWFPRFHAVRRYSASTPDYEEDEDGHDADDADYEEDEDGDDADEEDDADHEDDEGDEDVITWFQEEAGEMVKGGPSEVAMVGSVLLIIIIIMMLSKWIMIMITIVTI